MASVKTRLIFRAAVDVFSERGFEKATMDEIAAKASVAKGTIYYHFKSKEDLFVFLVEEGTELLREKVLSHLTEEMSSSEKIREIVRAQLAFFTEYRDFCIIILRETWGDEARHREFRRMLVHYVQSIRQVIAQGVDEQIFSVENAEVAAWSLFGSTSITALHHLFADPAVDLLALAPSLQAIALGGLHAKEIT
ncbi:TetR/AcrR family transcriptional regulator [Ferroacidibacillus organovorans]|uniref:TetR family transcriptional regulator n=1 Tax=Ferroacidibacillus organovorans TaxID=1765683 RepID=A0A162T091_9BACL|nr:TetR/AcrR family transcriptional regulator [Ferroacidibacillus organovorans]KYP80324.1 hypothetical protein AYJ22_11615 [Ferroacidibacillus organovorans]OAG93255.1 hypothetical protein AYW79_11535 [Ferroacidibacillus organovorans]OPG15270.1 TetR family transcriptional regulator [Ferroacidibacillus organovorans]